MGILGLFHCNLLVTVQAFPLQVFSVSFPLDVQCLVHLVQISCWTLAATTHVELVRQQTLFHFNFNIIIYFVFLTGNLRTWHLGSHW
jgi:hypothetical protein